VQAVLVEESNSKFNPKEEQEMRHSSHGSSNDFTFGDPKEKNKTEIRRQGTVGFWSSIQLLPFKSVIKYTISNG